jgi:excinuclease ABC subunit A
VSSSRHISIVNASENNLKSVSLDIPRNKLVVVTGVSGSGKSSLVFDVLYREAEARYFGTFSSYARQFLGRMKKPEVERVGGLSPAVAVDQGSAVNNPRSTVGTISGIHDSFRLLFARCGSLPEGEDFKLSRSLFSFNTADGACTHCKGLGVEDRIDPELLVADPNRSIRDRCMAVTTPNGYLMYSQVTLEVLDQVCRAEGFSIDIPWNELTEENRHVIFYGSDRIEVPFGKHPLESRMKWSGITAKPREMGVYKGIIPVMEEILRRDRNQNILKYVRSVPCPHCHGKRLNPRALSVKIGEWDIASLSELTLNELAHVLRKIYHQPLTTNHQPLTTDHQPPSTIQSPGSEIITNLLSLITVMQELSLGYLRSSDASGKLGPGESRRMKLASQMGSGLSGLIYVLDEPSAGLHSEEVSALISVLKRLRDQQNTVIVVEHDEEFIRQADHIIDIGPGPGMQGGEILFNLPTRELAGIPKEAAIRSKTLTWYLGKNEKEIKAFSAGSGEMIRIRNFSLPEGKRDVEFALGTLNVVTGRSGSGKGRLVHGILGGFLNSKSNGQPWSIASGETVEGWETIKKIVEIDQSPIGKTPRSNPATYTGLFDPIRDLFAGLPESMERGYGKSRFSFNTSGGRCEECEGAGYLQTGMHFMGRVEMLCESCGGRRFDEETLEVMFRGKNIFEILEMRISEALVFFNGEKRIRQGLEILESLGLGYLSLGQRSSTLSGGEAQRIRIASELIQAQTAGKKGSSGRGPSSSLYLMDNPTTGLHSDDMPKLLDCMEGLVEKGNTVICIEQHPMMLRAAGKLIDLSESSPPTTNHQPLTTIHQPPTTNHPPSAGEILRITGLTTHNLKNIDVEIPLNGITVITGVSGSGKSSLAFDTIHAESRNRFLGNFSAYARSRIGMKERPDFAEIQGLRPSFATEQSGIQSNPRSTVGTYTGIFDLYRLLFSRSGIKKIHQPLSTNHQPPTTNHQPPTTNHQPLTTDHRPLSSLFSFNGFHGACPSCSGLGSVISCDLVKLITHPGKPLTAGAMDGSRTGRFYGDPYGQFVATLRAAGLKHGFDFEVPWDALSQEAKNLALYGCGDEEYDVSWEFRRGDRSGIHHFKGQWRGFLALVNEEYTRKHADHRGGEMMQVMTALACNACGGSRLNNEALEWEFFGYDIGRLSGLETNEAAGFFEASIRERGSAVQDRGCRMLIDEILKRLRTLADLGLGYISVDRSTGTLSRGEARRLQFAAMTSSGLTGMIYVLDEPAAGLHPGEVSLLAGRLRELADVGNTVIAVEHDRGIIFASDYMIDMGPGAGPSGGRIIASGSVQEVMSNPDSPTGPYLALSQYFRVKEKRMMSSAIRIKNAYANNLKNFNLDIPLGGMVCVTGVSGAGKSSLLNDVILASRVNGRASGCSSIEGLELFADVTAAEAREDFSSPVATAATYTGLFDHIRKLFASTDEAKRKGFSAQHFSYLNRKTQCPDCGGTGLVRTSMDFLPDVVSICETCQGKRYREEILEITWCGKNIQQFLELSMSEALKLLDKTGSHAESDFPDPVSRIPDPVSRIHHPASRILHILTESGLGYLRLGQPLDTLSGGEAQRINLCRELAHLQPLTTHHQPLSTLYLFDEPFAGLHPADRINLLRLFDRLADAGNTLIITEHDPQVIAIADHVIELGPEGGSRGGYLLRG